MSLEASNTLSFFFSVCMPEEGFKGKAFIFFTPLFKPVSLHLFHLKSVYFFVCFQGLVFLDTKGFFYTRWQQRNDQKGRGF